MIRFVKDWATWSFATAWWNLRFDIGFKVGAFTYARRWDDEQDIPDGSCIATGMEP